MGKVFQSGWVRGTVTPIPQRLSGFCSVTRSAVSVHCRRNIGVTAVALSRELDPVQKVFVDEIRESRSKRQASAGPVATGPEHRRELEREVFQLKQMYGNADMNAFPDLKFEDTKFEVSKKPQS
ncbi:ATP synthase-coupling factor 6, mitochondrial-like [Molossus molossus]|uniref:ATP synthase-coupling factor 6, mitochondrial-like n=1 Tax=Molossus molossus TaxID=27622 RepID=UPI001745C4E9|nr:ATP synthase-coupling factor 6, mitochondrial-like [Molossus molossus]